MNNTYTVYIHTAPNNKRYVGITKFYDPHRRWESGGRGYIENTHFWNAICKYGWDKISHCIVASNLSKDDACNMEMRLISLYKTYSPQFGYNKTYGGEYSQPTYETRKKLSLGVKSAWTRPEYRNGIISKLQGHAVSQETRDKISAKNKGKKHGPSPMRGKPLSMEHRAKLCGHIPWSKGLTKDTHPILMQISLKQRGRSRSASMNAKQSASMLNKYAEGYAPTWINNGQYETTFDANTSEIPEGFVLGRLCTGAKYMYNDSHCIKVKPEDVHIYLDNGYQFGRGPTVSKSLSKGNKSKLVYIYDNIEFIDKFELVEYLQAHGYPSISDSTVYNAAKNRLTDKSKYKHLETYITWRLATDEDFQD